MYAPAAVIAENVPPTSGIVEAVDASTSLLVTGADSLGLIAMHLALLGHEFAVLEPPELVAEVGRLAQRIGNAYRSSA